MTGKTYELTWLPADWTDEFVPAPLRHPTDFLHQCDDGTYIVIPKESKDDLRPDGGIEDQGHLLFKGKRSADGVRLEVPRHQSFDFGYRPTLSDTVQGLG